MFERIILTLAAGAIALLAAEDASAQTLDKIRQRGVIVVGVKVDYKPFGFRDPQGAIVGFEPDLAADVAAALGVKLQLEPVGSSNRLQFLQQGKIDLMIATMNDTEERRKIVGSIVPDYYASGVNVLAPKSAGLKAWDDVRGKKLCAIQGAWYNKPIAERYGAEIIAYKGQAEAETALLQGVCTGWVYDDTAFAARLADTATWGDYTMPLQTILQEPFALAVPLAERDGTFGRFMSGMVYNWHRSGRLIELEKKWNIPTSVWLAGMHTKYSSDSNPIPH